MGLTKGQLAALSTLVAHVFAAPAQAQSSFHVDLVAKAKTNEYHPIHRLFSPWAKYGGQLSSNASKCLEQYGSVVATPVEPYDTEYLIPVQVGDQTLHLDVDTGSSDLWVFSDELPANESTRHPLYDTKGKTPLPGYSWSIGYADGSSSSGNVFKDKVVVGPVTATSQAVEAATSVAASFTNGSSDGLMGLAFDNINTVKPVKQLTFFSSVKPTLKKKLFAADLKHDAPGSYDFGFIDKTKYTGDITYTPVTNDTAFWQIAPGKMSVGNGRPVDAQIGPAVVDSGTTIIYLPNQATYAYWAEVPDTLQAYGIILVNCTQELPSLNIEIEGKKFVVQGEYIKDGGIPFLTSGYCLGGIQSSQGLPVAVLGDLFMKNFYVVFDQTKATPRVGLANKKLTS